MGKKVVSLRVDEETWAEAQEAAKGLEITQAALVEKALERFLTEPEPPQGVQAVTSYVGPKQAPVGECPKNEAGHEWSSAKDDPRRSCVHCGRPGRDGIDNGVPQIGGFFAEATAARTELFNRLRTPDSIRKGYPKKAA
jgi:hypothetical protein